MPSKALFDVGAIRELARERVEAASLRAVAAEIPMSKSGLEAFLSGRNPYTATRPKLAAWFVRNRRQGSPATEAELDAAVATLAGYVIQDERAEVQRDRLNALVQRLRTAVTLKKPET